MKRILFVDDDGKVLEGLRRMLRSFRHEWDMEFAEGGSQALTRLATAPCDVVVTDMRMPGMDGVQLLQEVMSQYPATVRLILSGQCDRQAVFRCVRFAHQFLTKPCDSQVIRSRIARVCSLGDDVVDDAHKRMLSRMTTVPSHPDAYDQLAQEVSSTTPSIQRVTEIVARDVGMIAKTLQLVSSSFFGTPRRVSSSAAALRLLGSDTVKPLVLDHGAYAPLDACAERIRMCECLNRHSLSVADAARTIAESETDDATMIGDAYLAGALHDVGAMALPEGLEDLATRRIDDEHGTVSFAPLHASAGAYLMALWGLPDPIVKAIGLQHTPLRSSDVEFTVLTAVHVAHSFIGRNGRLRRAIETLDVDYLDRIRCSQRIEYWRELCQAVCPEGVLT